MTTLRSKRTVTPQVFYGWWVLATLFLSGALVYGGGLYSFVLFVTPWTREFGWSRAATSGLVSAFWLSAPFILLGGQAVKRFGARQLLLAGIIVEAVGVCLLPLAHSLPQMYALRALMGFGKVMFGVALPVTIAIWFRKHFALALGVAWSGWSTGGLVLAPVSSVLVDRYGWRVACIAIGGGLLAFAFAPLLSILRTQSPADLGLGPDGGSVLPFATIDMAANVHRPLESGPPEQTVLNLLRSRAFWLIALATVAFYTAYAGALTQQAALVESAGFSGRIAAVVLACTAGLSAVSGPIFGWLLDRGNVVRIIIIVQMLLLAGVLTLSFGARTPSLTVFILYAVLFGVAIGAADVSWVALVKRRFPCMNIAHTFSAWYFVQITTLALAPIAVGHLYDVTGSYSRTIFVLAAGSAISIAAVLLSVYRGNRPL